MIQDVPGVILEDGRKAVGPDTARYWAAACGYGVPKPFHLRWLLPTLLGPYVKRWRIVWAGSWVVLSVAMFGWAHASGLPWQTATAAAVLLVALPGILGPVISIPVQPDLPATALVVVAVWLETLGHWPLALTVVMVAATVRETTPVWAAITATNPILLAGLIVPLIGWALIPQGPDPLGDRFAHVNDHPVRAAWDAHKDRWRDAWVMIAPWGVCLAALYQPSPELWLILGLGYAQLLVATDTVRLYQHAAGPLMALTAATVIPIQWVPLALAAHVCWWTRAERV